MSSVLGWSSQYIPGQPDPLSEIYRWKAQPELEHEILYAGDMDSNGVIWFAGDSALLAYDGYTAEAFPFPESWNEMGVGKDLLSTKNGFIYALYQNGVFRFQPAQGFDLIMDLQESDGIATSLSETTDESVWLGVREGLFRIETGTPKPVETKLGAVRSLLVDAMGHLWIATETNDVVVFSVDPGREPLLQLQQSIPIPESVQGSASHLFQRTDGTIWMLNTDPSWVVIEFNPELEIQSIPFPDGFESSLGFNYCPTPSGRILFSDKSTTAQFYRGSWLDLNLDDYPVATHESFAISLSDNHLLIGGSHTERYLIDLSDDRWLTYTDLVFYVEDRNNRQWFIDKDQRVIVHDSANEAWSLLSSEDGMIDSPNSVYCSRDGTIWVSGMHENQAALTYFKEDRWHRETFPEVGYTLGHLAICELPGGLIVFGNGSDAYYDDRPGGAVIYHPANSETEFNVVSEPFFPHRPANITSNRENELWIAGSNLYKKVSVNSPDLNRKDRFRRNWTDHIIVDSMNNLWVANWRSGLFRFDGEDWEEIRDERDNSQIQATYILEGTTQNGIWIASIEGLHRFDGHGWSYNVFDGDFKFAKESATLVESTDGSLWLNFSHRNWFVNSPSSHTRRSHIHRSIRYRPDNQAPETEFVRQTDQLEEPANAFFSWRGQDRWEDTPRDDLTYSYRLSGGDWSEFSERTEIALLDLPSGNYTLEVRSRDYDLNVDASPALATFRVLPPLWKRAWFITALAGVLIAAVVLITIIVQQRIRYTLALTEFRIGFFANLSHELRTPLSVILGPLQGLIQNAKTSKDRQSLEMVQRNANKLLGLVNQLLEFRKVELGKLEFYPQAGEIISFTKDAIYSLSPLWEQKQQRVKITLHPSPFYCEFDPDKLIRITDNLISNAIKYTSVAGAIHIVAEVIQDQDNDPRLILKIEDDGRGIPKERLAHITEPFYTARNKNREKNSIGIGLALVKELVSLWNGSLEIESETKGPRRGTRVHVTLPLHPAKTEEDTPVVLDPVSDEESDEHPLAGSHQNGLRKKVLVVEDNPDLRCFLVTELSAYFEVDSAENGLIGIERSIEAPPDLIISDVMMPEMNGIELCRKIRETPEISHIPIILLTARTAEEHYLEGIQSGADEYFGKPVSAPKLIARIQNLLQSRQNIYELFAKQVVVEPTKIAVVPADQLFLKNAIQIAEENMRTEAFDVDAFAQNMAVSRATLNRKIKAITGISPNAFIRTMRLKRAAQLLASSDLSINEIFFQVGFLDASNFSRAFKREFGKSPSDYREAHQETE